MSVTKPSMNYPRAIKDPHWSIENISKWIVRLILDGILVFSILASTMIYIDMSDTLEYFFYLMIIFIISDFFAFFLAFAIIKAIATWRRRRVKSLMSTIKARKRFKKLWIYIFTLIFEVMFFMFSVALIIADKIQLPKDIALIMAWIIIWISAKALGRLLYFVFYTM